MKQPPEDGSDASDDPKEKINGGCFEVDIDNPSTGPDPDLIVRKRSNYTSNICSLLVLWSRDGLLYKRRLYA